MNKKEIEESLKSDKKIHFRNLSSEQKMDIDIVSMFIRANGKNFAHIPSEFQDNKDLAMLALESYDSILKYTSNRLRENEELILKEVKIKTDGLIYVPKYLLANKEFGFKLLKVNQKCFQYLEDNLRNDIDIVTEAFKPRVENNEKVFNKSGIEKIGQTILKNRDVVSNLIKINIYVFAAAKDFHNDIELCYQAIENGFTEINVLPLSMTNSKFFINKFLKAHPEKYNAFKGYQNNEYIAKLSIERYPYIYSVLTERLQTNLEIAKIVLNSAPESLYKLHKDIKKNIDFLMPYLEREPFLLSYIDKEIRMKEENIYKLQPIFSKNIQQFQVENDAFERLERKKQLEATMFNNIDEQKQHIKKKI